MTIDVGDLVAIDVHTHAEISEDGHGSLSPELIEASAKYFTNPAKSRPTPTQHVTVATKSFGRDCGRISNDRHSRAGEHRQPTIPEMAAYYRERRMAAVVFTVDAEHATGHPRIANEEVARSCAEHPDVLIPFASVDPWKGKAGAREARRLVTEHGVRGFKFHPSIQGFAPNDPVAYPLYEVIEELGVPALFHSGQTGIGAGVPGGGGIRLKYSNPMLVDDVAVDFPELRIILAHPSFPWQDEALAVATHKPYVHIDLSGWSPKYFPPQLVRYANSLLQDKVLFGSDYPVLTPDRWLADFAELDIKPEVRPKILKTNAARLLGLTKEGERP
ncbi:amidohydrolase family protein [Amycolatopsis sp. NPDC059027]|uniref:amidohydrolase family protein n=1 Tax=unclassified Amycolatopsis TaxID=2618356 RepID=UPI003672F5E6